MLKQIIDKKIFKFNIENLSFDEQNLINRIYHIVRNLKGDSVWNKAKYHFYVIWTIQNDKIYLDKIYGNGGDNYTNVYIDIYDIEFTDNGIKITGDINIINNILDRVIKSNNISDTQSEDFNINVQKLNYVKTDEIDNLIDKIWDAVISNTINPKYKIEWFLNNIKNLLLTHISGIDDDNNEFMFDFYSLCSGFFELKYNGVKYVFTNHPRYGNFEHKNSKSIYLTPGSDFYNDGNHYSYHMDSEHKNICVHLTNKIFKF